MATIRMDSANGINSRNDHLPNNLTKSSKEKSKSAQLREVNPLAEKLEEDCNIY